MAILTKADILNGIKNPQKIEIKALNGELWLRPLSSAEVNEVTNIEAEGYGTFNAKQSRKETLADAKMSLPVMQKATAKAKYTAIEKSLDNPKNPDKFTYEDVKNFKIDAIDEIYDHVMDLSGANTTETDVKKFPED